MTKFAVSYINFFDNNLITKIVSVEGTWRDALLTAFPDMKEFQIPNNLKDAKTQAFDGDCMIEVMEIT